MALQAAQIKHLQEEVLELLAQINLTLHELKELMSQEVSLLDLAAEIISPMQAKGLVRFRLSGNMCSIGAKGSLMLRLRLREQELANLLATPRPLPGEGSKSPVEPLTPSAWSMGSTARSGASDFLKIPSRVGDELVFKH